MTPDDFVAGLRSGVIEENLTIYRTLFSENSPEDAEDPYWKRALALFQALSPEHRSVLFEVIRQVAVDTTSNLLGVLDGVNPLNERFVEFSLADDEGSRLSGDLQDLFLQQEEDSAS
jgi:hypothetical protein